MSTEQKHAPSMTMFEEALRDAALVGWNARSRIGIRTKPFEIQKEELVELLRQYPVLAAAPQLLAACKATRRHLYWASTHGDRCDEVLEQVNDAIAEVEKEMK
jgi:hypothetical protein